jgi:RHS repeat-associated protein
MEAMHTWRSGEGWDSPIWPSANDGLADITHWHYHEASGLLESKEDAQNKNTQYTYFQGGRLHTRTWARNAASLVTTYSYDPNTGELTGIDYSDTTPDIGFTYNRTGQRSTVTDAVGSRSFTYNTALQPETETLTGLINRTLTRTYETAGVVGRNTGFNTNSSYAATYGFDSTGRFNGVSWNVGTHSDSVTYVRMPDSHLLHTTTFASGALVTNSYEPHRNLKIGVKNQYGAATISQYDYLYDKIGRRKTATMTGDVFDNPALLPAPDELLMIYTGTTISATYTTNDLNQYNAVDTNDAVVNPLYDEDGGLTDDGTFTYTWNGENRLIEATPKIPAVGDEKLEFLYDYMGRRVRKITSAWDGTAWQPADAALFVYDGWNLIEELDGEGDTTASYVHGLDLSQSLQGAGGIGGILARIDHGASKSHIYFYDANGNVGQLLDSSDGSVAAAYEYAPFGGLTSAMGSYAEVNPFRFSSKYSDDVAGLYYYGYRYYSLVLGRWLNRDSIGENGGVNLYGFVGNEPLNAFDLFGLYEVYLTFDDGPDYGTDDILNNLKAEKVKASFYVNLTRIHDKKRWGAGRTNWNRNQLARIRNEGHLLANHSYSHEYWYDEPKRMVSDMALNVQVAQEGLGDLYSDSFEQYGRLPGSNTWRTEDISRDVMTRNNSTKDTADLLSSSGYKLHGWDIEWKMSGKGGYGLVQSPQKMADEIMTALKGGKTEKSCKIILLAHDRQFKSSNGNDNKLKRMIQILKLDDPVFISLLLTV